MDWKNIIFGPQWLDKLDQLAVRRFGEGGLAQEASSYVLEKLSEDDWSVLSSFQGNCQPETFLHTLAKNYLEEFSRKRFGRMRPPKWLSDQGDFWIKIWKMLCLERMEIPVLVDSLLFRDMREESVIRHAIKTIKAQLPWCGHSNKEFAAASLDGEYKDSSDDLIADYRTPDDHVTSAFYRQMLMLMSLILNDNPDPAKRVDGLVFEDDHIVETALLSKLKRMRQELELSDLERVILKMVYQDGIKRKTVAQALGLAEYMPGRIIQKALDRIHAAFIDAGISFEGISELTNKK
ncbi:MAG: hypothetical protein OEZ43_12790 [Gammaproteobacteria bacterium]|nr:hypothetical protein [Gammaproteobacteria bacterium]